MQALLPVVKNLAQADNVVVVVESDPAFIASADRVVEPAPGFRVVAFTPDVAVICFVSRFSLTGRLQATTTTLKWTGGDWQLELQPDGGLSPTALTVPDLDGFVVWGGA